MLIPFEDSLSFKKKLDKYSRPLFLFDDDADGVCSFLMLYRYFDGGAGVIVKGNPELQASYLNMVTEHRPDCIIILDKPLVSEDFFKGTNLPIFWLDHHELQQPSKSFYLNPKTYLPNEASSTSSVVWDILTTDNNLDKAQFEWLCLLGAISDWDLRPINNLDVSLASLIGNGDKGVEDILFNSRLGLAIKIINFNLKGKKHEAMKSIKAMNNLVGIFDLLDNSSDASVYLHKKYKIINDEYELIKSGVSGSSENPVLTFKYDSDVASITAELSNELIYLNPDKIVLVARPHRKRYLCSLRSKKLDISDTVSGVAEKYGGYGGGHKNACGASIPIDYFDLFVEELTREIENA